MKRYLLILKAVAAVFCFVATVCHADEITVFAASSLSDALSEAGAGYRAATGHSIAFSFASSSVLAREIQNSKGVDIFISADVQWMDYLDRRGLIARQTRRKLVGNHLVLIAPVASKVRLRIAPRFDLAAALRGGRLAIGDPETVPAGKYAKAALMSLGEWQAVSSHLAPAENVRVALSYVARGESPLGIVYVTDAISEPLVRIVGTFPDASHPPIVYLAALVAGGNRAAMRFLDYLNGARAQAIFDKYGFAVPGSKGCPVMRRLSATKVHLRVDEESVGHPRLLPHTESAGGQSCHGRASIR